MITVYFRPRENNAEIKTRGWPNAGIAIADFSTFRKLFTLRASRRGQARQLEAQRLVAAVASCWLVAGGLAD